MHVGRQGTGEETLYFQVAKKGNFTRESAVAD